VREIAEAGKVGRRPASPPQKENSLAYEVINLTTEESHGEFETLDEARGAVRYDRLHAYSIWCGNVRVEACEPYEGGDDRVKQGLGQHNASEADDYR
jgi:hypothetical protein